MAVIPVRGDPIVNSPQPITVTTVQPSEPNDLGVQVLPQEHRKNIRNTMGAGGDTPPSYSTAVLYNINLAIHLPGAQWFLAGHCHVSEDHVHHHSITAVVEELPQRRR